MKVGSIVEEAKWIDNKSGKSMDVTRRRRRSFEFSRKSCSSTYPQVARYAKSVKEGRQLSWNKKSIFAQTLPA